jgi:hypothetical protein
LLQDASEYYASASTILVDIGDRLGQIEVLVGMTKSMEMLKESSGACECRVSIYHGLIISINLPNASSKVQARISYTM